MAVDPIQLEHWYGPLAARLIAEKENSLVDLPMIKKILRYSFEPVSWTWESLTPREKDIIPNQETFNKLRSWVESE